MTRHRSAVLLLSLTALVAAALGLSACGKRENTATGPTSLSRINLVLDYSVNADHVGIFTALKQGDFAQAGLDIGRPQVPSDPSAPLKLLLAGRADLAISYEPEVFLARDKPGAKLVSVAALVQRPLTSIMSLHGKVTKPADLEGKTVGTAGIPYQSAYLRTIENGAGVDPSSVKEVNVGFNLIPAMVGRNADATLGAFWNIEGVELKLDHRRPTIIPVDKAGVPTYDELVLVARADYLRDHGPLVRRFIQALGVSPKWRTNVSVKWLCAAKPRRRATSHTGRPSRSNSSERFTRSRSRYWWMLDPVAARKLRARWNGEEWTRSASVASASGSPTCAAMATFASSTRSRRTRRCRVPRADPPREPAAAAITSPSMHSEDSSSASGSPPPSRAAASNTRRTPR